MIWLVGVFLGGVGGKRGGKNGRSGEFGVWVLGFDGWMVGKRKKRG